MNDLFRAISTHCESLPTADRRKAYKRVGEFLIDFAQARGTRVDNIVCGPHRLRFEKTADGTISVSVLQGR